MAEEGKMLVAGEEEVVEVVDEYQQAFDAIDEGTCKDVGVYLALLSNVRVDDTAAKIKEYIIYRLARLYTETKMFAEVMSLLQSNNAFFAIITKAKTAKIVRNILNIVASVPDSLAVQISLCRDVVAWCKAEKKTFLKQRIEAQLANLLLKQGDAQGALALVNSLLFELKKLDDKQMLTEVHLTESRIYHTLQNIPKSKASLTASRTAANAIYVVPLLQAELDEMSGILHCEESDNSTAYSYFLEAFEAYDSCGANSSKQAVSCLKYMILSKVLSDAMSDVPAILNGKHGLKHMGPELEAMSAIAKAAKSRSLEGFQLAVRTHSAHLQSDTLISHHLELLYEKMFEANLLKIIAPYSAVEIEHVSKLIKLDVVVVEKKLSQMILDHRFKGILDQGRGVLVVFESVDEDTSFTKGVEIVGNMGQVVDVLMGRAKRLAKGIAV